jgi:polyisoprenoid-binding protein YceI
MTDHPIVHNGVRTNPSEAPLPAGAWSVDAEASHARFTAAALAGLVKTPGHFRDVTGHLTVEQGGATGVLTIDAASIDTGNRLRDSHLRRRDFFAVAEHPELRYELDALTPAGPGKVRLSGRLIMAGTTTALPLDADLRIHTHKLIEIVTRTEVDRIALGVRGSRGMVPRTVELDISVVLRRGER